MQSFMIRVSILVGLILVAPMPVVAESCRLCAPEAERLSQGGRSSVPLRIEIETALDLGRVAQGAGGGAVELDPRTGVRRVAGALAFLHRIGLVPVVVHGAGLFTGRKSSRVAAAAASGEGAGALIGAAYDYLAASNAGLVAALRQEGVDAVPLLSGVFRASREEDTEGELAGVVGRIRGVVTEAISSAVAAG